MLPLIFPYEDKTYILTIKKHTWDVTICHLIELRKSTRSDLLPIYDTDCM